GGDRGSSGLGGRRRGLGADFLALRARWDGFGGFFDRDCRAEGGAGAGGEGGRLGLGLVEGGDQGVVVGGLGVAGQEGRPTGAGGAGGDGGVDQFAGSLRFVEDDADPLCSSVERAFVPGQLAHRDLAGGDVARADPGGRLDNGDHGAQVGGDEV